MKKLLLFSLLSSASLALAGNAMTNEDVIKMAKAGFSAELVVNTINAASEKKFDTSADALIAMKTAQVPESVIAAILGQSRGMSPPEAGSAAQAVPPASPVASATSSSPEPLRKGIYFVHDGARKRASTITPSEVKKPFATFNPNYKIKAWFNGTTGAYVAKPGDQIIISGWDLEPQVARLKADGGRRLALLKHSGSLVDEDLVSLDFTRDGEDNWVATLPSDFPKGEYWVLVPTSGDDTPAADFSVR